MHPHASSASQDNDNIATDLFGDHLDEFRRHLLDQSHAESTVAHYLRCIGILADMMTAQSVALAELDEAQAVALIAKKGWNGNRRPRRIDPLSQPRGRPARARGFAPDRPLSARSRPALFLPVNERQLGGYLDVRAAGNHANRVIPRRARRRDARRIDVSVDRARDGVAALQGEAPASALLERVGIDLHSQIVLLQIAEINRHRERQ